MDLDKKKIDFVKALCDTFIKKIEINEKFKNARVTEWCRNIPVPPLSEIDSTDCSNLARIKELHEYLVELDAKHTAFGVRWPTSVVNDFLYNCEELKRIITNKNVAPSIINLYHFHSSICHRSSGDQNSAIDEITSASRVLQEYINSNEGFWPRYRRNLILNKGHESDFYKRKGDVTTALEKANEAISMADKLSKIDEFVIYEEQNNLGPVKSWALYSACCAHLAVDDWEEAGAKEARDYTFTQTFAEQHHLNWNLPTQIQILKNGIWQERYPDYFDEVANLVFIGTADKPVEKLMRQLSVICGRVALRPAPALAAALLVILSMGAMATSGSNNAPPEESHILHVLNETVREVSTYEEFVSMDTTDVDSVRDSILKSLDSIDAPGDEFLNSVITVSDTEFDSLLRDSNPEQTLTEQDELWFMHTAGTNGNEQGVGPGRVLLV